MPGRKIPKTTGGKCEGHTHAAQQLLELSGKLRASPLWRQYVVKPSVSPSHAPEASAFKFLFPGTLPAEEFEMNLDEDEVDPPGNTFSGKDLDRWSGSRGRGRAGRVALSGDFAVTAQLGGRVATCQPRTFSIPGASLPESESGIPGVYRNHGIHEPSSRLCCPGGIGECESGILGSYRNQSIHVLSWREI